MKNMLLKLQIIFLPLLFSFQGLFAQTDTLYTDALYPQWFSDNWGGNTNSLTCTTKVYRGNYAIEINYNDYGNFGFDRRASDWTAFYYMYPNQYKYVSFYFNAGSDPDKLDAFGVHLSLDKSVLVKDYINGTIAANTWYYVKIPIADMNPDNKGFFRLYFINASSNTSAHVYIDDIIFEYVNDGTKPVISGVTVSNIEQDRAKISWLTDEVVLYSFKYRVQGSGSAYTTVNTSEYEVGGTQKLSMLNPNTTYEYTIECSDHQKDVNVASNISAYSGTFKTSTADVTKPVITNCKVESIYANRAVVTWTTNEISDSRLYYGQTDFGITYSNTVLTKTHSALLTNLKPGTTYQYKIASQDRFGNLAEYTTTPALSFTTTALAQKDTIGRWLAVYHPIYQWGLLGYDAVPWDKISHLIIGYLWLVDSPQGYTLQLEPDSYYAGSWGGWNRFVNESKEYIKNGHAQKRKVTCMLGGEGSNPGFIWSSATAAGNITKFAQNIASVLKGIGFDGVDLDWEDDVDYPLLVNLAKEIRKEWPEAIITIPTDFDGSDASKLAGAKDAVDAFMPMSYIPVEQWGGWTLPVPLTPLHTAGSNPYSADFIVDQFTNAGIPLTKVVLGVGGFGSVWGDSNNDGLAPIAPYANIQNDDTNPSGEGGCIGGDNLVTWKFVKDVLTEFPEMEEGWDDIGKCTYWRTASENDQISVLYPGRSYYLDISLMFYETPRSISEKINYIADKNLKGMMFWTLSQLFDGTLSAILETTQSMPLVNTANNTPTGLEAVNNIQDKTLDIKIYPNPASSNFTIKVIGTTELINLSIYTVTGSLIYSKVEKADKVITLNTGLFAKGTYIVKITNSQIAKTMKILID